jgi:hypothetical protein
MRSPNRNAPTPLELPLQFQPHEFRMLRFNRPGPSGLLGGYPRHENWLIEHTDAGTLVCKLPPAQLARTIKYIKCYGTGGPNQRIRNACIPALRRAGIDLYPEWRTPPGRRSA